MLTEDTYFKTLTDDELWQRYCGFLDLSPDEFMNIQRQLLLDEIDLVADSTLGKKIIGSRKPKSVDEFRRTVPLTTYDDYEPYLSEKQEDALAVSPHCWCHSSGRGGRFKWFPVTAESLERSNRNFLASAILSSASKKGQVNIRPGFRFLGSLPPPPYISGSGFQYFIEHFSCRPMPPPKVVKNMEFRERMQKGFQMALRDGVDILGALSSVLVRMGEGFAEQTRKPKFSSSMLHPKVIFRFLRAWLRSNREKRVILPKDLWAPKGIVASGLDTGIYKQDIAYYWGSEPFDFYASTEALYIAMQAWNKKAMTFIPDVAFLEFIPYEEHLKLSDNKGYKPYTVLLNELAEGELYELIITQFHGMPLLRYRINDLIKVTSLEDGETGVNLPQIVIQRRVGETIHLAGLADLDEKTIWRAIANTGIKYTDWSACKDYDQNQSFLHLYLELREEREPAEVASMIDEQLKIVDTDYNDINEYLQLQPVRVTLLSPGTFQRYMDERVREGADLAHLKPNHVNPPAAVIDGLVQLSEVKQ
jgi:hypothetical protein